MSYFGDDGVVLEGKEVIVPWYSSAEHETVWECGGNPDHIPEYDWQCPEE